MTVNRFGLKGTGRYLIGSMGLISETGILWTLSGLCSKIPHATRKLVRLSSGSLPKSSQANKQEGSRMYPLVLQSQFAGGTDNWDELLAVYD